MEKIIEKLKKIKALADKGFKGEAVAAKNMLDEMLKKYGLSLEDLQFDRTEERRFKFRSVPERKVMLHVALKMFGRNSPQFKSFGIYTHYKECAIELNDIDFVDYSNMCDFYITQLRKEVRKFQKTVAAAFVNKHNLFDDSDDDNEESPKDKKIDWEHIMYLNSLIGSMSDAKYHKQLI